MRIRDTKFRKSDWFRCINDTPLWMSTSQCDVGWEGLANRCSFLFAAPGSRIHGYCHLSPSCARTGASSGPGQPGPRIHDLRHTFAVRAHWNRPRKLKRALPVIFWRHEHLRGTRTRGRYVLVPSGNAPVDVGIADACQQYLRREMP